MPTSPPPGGPSEGTSKKRSAFSALMSPHPKKPATSMTTVTPALLALGPYIASPDTYPPSIIITYNDHFVTIRDKFPKSQIHLLLLPRDQTKTRRHPLTVLSSDSAFLALVREESEKIKHLVAAELKRRHGDKNRRDWGEEVKVGVHANPSMAHMHIHIMSREMGGAGMKKSGHYSSFNSRFFVGLDEFPLPDDDVRWTSEGARNIVKGDMKCWRCGSNFGRRWKQLQEHLREEVEEWEKEEGDGSEVGEIKNESVGAGKEKDGNGKDTSESQNTATPEDTGQEPCAKSTRKEETDSGEETE